MANDKVFTSEALVAKFEEALADQWGYIWGTAGVLWTAAKQANLEKTTDENRANSRKYGKKWIGHMVADCSGLFSWAFKQLGGAIYHGSDSIWNRYCTAKGELRNGAREDGKPLLPGTAVFVYKKAKGNRSHIGLYIGGGWVIEAKGANAGVVRSKVTESKWSEWGELKGVDYSGATPEPGPEPEPVKKPTIKRGSRNQYVKECQEILQKLGYNLGICGVDGDFGHATEQAVRDFQKAHDGPDGRALAIDGIVGPATWWALEAASEGQGRRYTVTIKGLAKAVADDIQKKYGGTVTEE